MKETNGSRALCERTTVGGPQDVLFFPQSSCQYSSAEPRDVDPVAAGKGCRSAEKNGDTESGSSSETLHEDLRSSNDTEVIQSRSLSPGSPQRTLVGELLNSNDQSNALPGPSIPLYGSLGTQPLETLQSESRGTQPRDTLYDEAVITPYVTRSGRRSIPVMRYQAGVSPTVAELKHKYELFLKRNGEGE